MPHARLNRRTAALAPPLPDAVSTVAAVRFEPIPAALPVELAARIGALEAEVAELRQQLLAARLHEQQRQLQLQARREREAQLRRRLAERWR